MRECMANNELSLHVRRAEDGETTLVQFIDKRGTIGVKYFHNGNRWYL